MMISVYIAVVAYGGEKNVKFKRLFLHGLVVFRGFCSYIHAYITFTVACVGLRGHVISLEGASGDGDLAIG